MLRPDGAFALTTNRAGHMRELYEAFERALAEDEAARARLRIQVERRGTVDSLVYRQAQMQTQLRRDLGGLRHHLCSKGARR